MTPSAKFGAYAAAISHENVVWIAFVADDAVVERRLVEQTIDTIDEFQW